MLYLLTASIIWSLSFGLIKTHLTTLPPNLVSLIRMAISFLVFLPFIRVRKLPGSMILRLGIIGAVQYGMMYIVYIYAYRYLKGYEIALFTIFTPVYISIIYDVIKRKFHSRTLIVSILAVLGTAVVVYRDVGSPGLLYGFFLIQLSNICFAWGQVRYREVMKKNGGIQDREIFGLLYAGALIVTFFSAFFTVDPGRISISTEQWLVLIYLGSVASGLAFFLWNFGVRRSGIGAISVMNNLKIPLAIMVSMTVFGETGNLPRIIIGMIVLIIALAWNSLSSREKTELPPGTPGK